MGCLTANVGTGELEVLAQEVNQQEPRFDEPINVRAIHLHTDLSLFWRGCPRITPQLAFPAARFSARITMLPSTCLRYSTGPRSSAAGAITASAASAAFFSDTSSRVLPTTDEAAFSASKGLSETFVSPIEQVWTLPPSIVNTTAAAAVA